MQKKKQKRRKKKETNERKDLTLTGLLMEGVDAAASVSRGKPSLKIKSGYGPPLYVQSDSFCAVCGRALVRFQPECPSK